MRRNVANWKRIVFWAHPRVDILKKYYKKMIVIVNHNYEVDKKAQKIYMYIENHKTLDNILYLSLCVTR